MPIEISVRPVRQDRRRDGLVVWRYGGLAASPGTCVAVQSMGLRERMNARE
jgi:hypothetical protein